MDVYLTFVLPIFLYSCEMWTWMEVQTGRLEVTHSNRLHHIAGVKLMDRHRFSIAHWQSQPIVAIVRNGRRPHGTTEVKTRHCTPARDPTAAAERALGRQAWRDAITNLAPLKFKKPQQVGHMTRSCARRGGNANVVQPFLACDTKIRKLLRLEKPVQRVRSVPIAWSGVPIAWSGVPIAWSGVPIAWSGVPIAWSGVPIAWSGVPIAWSGVPIAWCCQVRLVNCAQSSMPVECAWSSPWQRQLTRDVLQRALRHLRKDVERAQLPPDDLCHEAHAQAVAEVVQDAPQLQLLVLHEPHVRKRPARRAAKLWLSRLFESRRRLGTQLGGRALRADEMGPNA
eukprot:366333-Chlamydomonas_euryale.AAC.10